MAEYLCSIVKAATCHPTQISLPTGVKCRRRPDRKPCNGEVEAILKDETGTIEWFCFVCGDSGFISDWENTEWDVRFADLILVRFGLDERNIILSNTFSGPDLTNRLKVVAEVSDTITVFYTSNELEELIRYIAAEANHTEDKETKNFLDDIFGSLDDLLDSHKLLIN